MLLLDFVFHSLILKIRFLTKRDKQIKKFLSYNKPYWSSVRGKCMWINKATLI